MSIDVISPNPDITPPTWAEVDADFNRVRSAGTDWQFIDVRQSPELYIGQELAQESLATFIRSSPTGTVATIQGRFGTGKSSLIDKVCSDMGNGASGVLRVVDYSYFSGELLEDASDEVLLEKARTQLQKERTRPGISDGESRNILVVEEVGRLLDSAQSSNSLRALNLLLQNGDIEKLIITGDDTLRSDEFVELFGDSLASRIELEPLTASTLKDTLVSYMANSAEAEALREKGPQILQSSASIKEAARKLTELAVVIELQARDPSAYDELFAPGFLEILARQTEPPTASYRETLGMIFSIAQASKKAPGAALFDGEAYSRAYKDDYENLYERMSSAQIDVMEWFRGKILETHREGTVLEAITAKTLMKEVVGTNAYYEIFVEKVILGGKHRKYPRLVGAEGSPLITLGTSDLTKGRLEKTMDALIVPGLRVFTEAHYGNPLAYIERPSVDDSTPNFEGSPAEIAEVLVDTYTDDFIGLNALRRGFAQLLKNR